MNELETNLWDWGDYDSDDRWNDDAVNNQNNLGSDGQNDSPSEECSGNRICSSSSEESSDDGLSASPSGESSGNRMTNRTASEAKPSKLDEDSASLPTNADLINVVIDTMSKASFNAHSMTKAYERLSLPSLPASDGIDSWIRTVKWLCALAGDAFADGLEAAWLDECSSLSCEQWSSPLWSNPPSLQSAHDRPERWRKLDCAVAQTLGYSIEQNQEIAAKAVLLRKREHEKPNSTLRGRQVIWIILDHFRADRAPLGQQRLPRPKGKGKGSGKYTTNACPVLPVPQEPGGVACNSPSDGLCWTFVHNGENAGLEVAHCNIYLPSA